MEVPIEFVYARIGELYVERCALQAQNQQALRELEAVREQVVKLVPPADEEQPGAGDL